MRINQNVMAFNAHRNLSSTSVQMGKSLEKLSSGFRINRAADDAAGLVISNRLRAQISGLRVASRNAQDGISVVQTAESSLNEVQSMLNRMRDLAVQSANTGSNDSAARTAAQAELSELRSEVDRIAGATSFGTNKLLDGTYGITPARVTLFDSDSSVTFAGTETFTIDIDGEGAVTVALDAAAGMSGSETATFLAGKINSALAAASSSFAGKVSASSVAVGAGASITLEVAGLTATETFVMADVAGTALADLNIGTVAAAAGSGGTFQVGSQVDSTEQIVVNIGAVDSVALGIGSIDVSTDASAAQVAIDVAINSISALRGELGAKQNRFESTIANLDTVVENLSASESRIRDADMALEMTAFTRNQILVQAGTAMLAQANAVPQNVLQLLRG